MVDSKLYEHMCQEQTSTFQIDTRYQAYYSGGHAMFVQITLYADSIFWSLLGIASIAMDM